MMQTTNIRPRPNRKNSRWVFVERRFSVRSESCMECVTSRGRLTIDDYRICRIVTTDATNMTWRCHKSARKKPDPDRSIRPESAGNFSRAVSSKHTRPQGASGALAWRQYAGSDSIFAGTQRKGGHVPRGLFRVREPSNSHFARHRGCSTRRETKCDTKWERHPDRRPDRNPDIRRD